MGQDSKGQRMQGQPTPEHAVGPGSAVRRDEPGSDSADHAPSGPISSQPFGANLEPVLHKATGGRLSAINWFRTDWQRGGALTGFSHYRLDDGQSAAAMIKLPVPPGERMWLERLQSAGDVVPRLYAHGQALAGYDMAWVVMERMPHGPLGAAWQGRQFDLLIEAAGRFYKAAQEFEVAAAPPHRDWQAILQKARRKVSDGALPEAPRWKKALKSANGKFKSWLKVWEDRPRDCWCHGDLHLANAMTRSPAPDGPAVLIDLALTHPGHWVEDAVYFEHLYWSRRQLLDGRRLCSLIARQRKQLGLTVEDDWSRLAQIRRLLTAVATPADLQHEGNRQHLEATLELLEAELG